MKNFKTNYIIGFTLCLLLISIILFSFKQSNRSPKLAIPSQRCLIVSDIHFSPLYGALKDTLIKKRLESSSFNEWKTYFESSAAQMKLDTTLLYQDANYAVLQSAVINMKKQLPNPAFIIIAGDFLWHNAVPADSILKKKTIQFISRLFKDSFPNSLIIPALGNNDTYGLDYGLQNAKFLKDFAMAWQPNLPAPAVDSLIEKSYYSCETGYTRFLVLNSAVVSFGTNHPEAAKMLNWLQWNLDNANGKNIWIISHIPPGINGYSALNMWDVPYSRAFTNMVVEHAGEIKFIIAGHTHFNDFKVIYNNSKARLPVSFMRIVPSVCSTHGNYPSFEIAGFNPSTGKIINETNYYLNLRTVPEGIKPGQAVYADTINVGITLKLGQINAANFSQVINSIKADKTGAMLRNYVRFYNIGTQTDSLKTINRKNYLKYMQADSLKQL